jgi:hypothetical protein
MTNSNFQIGQLVKINSKLTRHNKIAHGLNESQIVEIMEIDNNKNKATVLILRESTSTLDGSKFRCRYTIKLEALDNLN